MLPLFISAALYVAYSDLQGRALEQGDHDLAARAQGSADRLDQLMRSRLIQVFTLAALPSMRGLAASDEAARAQRTVIAMAELRAITAADPNVRAASVVDNMGKVILTTDGSMNEQWGDRTFAREALAGRLSASPPSRDVGEISQFYSAPILDNVPNVAGALVLRVAVQEMWDMLQDRPNLFVVDDNGVIVADTTPAPTPFYAIAPLASGAIDNLAAEKHYGSELAQIRSRNLTALQNALARDATGAVYTDSNGATVHAAISKLTTNSWRVVAFETEQVITAPAQHGWRNLLFVGALSGLAGAIATALLMYRRALRVN